MSLKDFKIKQSDIDTKGVVGAPDVLSGTAAENKMIFDRLIRDAVAVQFNALVDALTAASGASEIGAAVEGIDAGTVLGVLSALKVLHDTTVEKQETINTNVQRELNNRYTKEQTDNLLKAKADTTTTNQLVKSISFNADTGVFTITTQGGSVSTIDTLLERVPASFSLEGNQLVLTLEDGTRQTADLSAFIENVLPKVTEEDNEKVLTAKDGEWKAEELKVGWEKIDNKPFYEENYEEEFTGYSSSSTLSFEVPALSESKKCYKMFNLALSYKDLLGTKIGFLRSSDLARYTGTPTEKDFIANDENISAFTVVLKNVLDSTRTVSETFLVARKAGEVETELGVLNIPIVGTYLLYGESIAALRVVSMSGVRIKTLDEKYLPAREIEDVKFTEDLTTTYEIGNIVLENGRAVIPAAGKTIQEVWDTIFVTEKNPTVEEPKVLLTVPEAKAYEVGEKVTPSYSAALSAGKYSYGPDTGITASAWAVKDTKGAELTSSVGAFAELTVRDDTSYSITARATHGAGAIPFTNLGNEYPDGRIVAGTKEATSAKITGYRNGFYGTAADKEAAIDSSFVRGLANKSGKMPAAGNVWNLAIPVGAMRIVFAYPATIRDVSSVLDVNGLNAEIKSAFTKYTVSVEGANGYEGIDYKVYVLDRAAATTEANTFKITI